VYTDRRNEIAYRIILADVNTKDSDIGDKLKQTNHRELDVPEYQWRGFLSAVFESKGDLPKEQLHEIAYLFFKKQMWDRMRENIERMRKSASRVEQKTGIMAREMRIFLGTMTQEVLLESLLPGEE
jgi:hypothetical protein